MGRKIKLGQTTLVTGELSPLLAARGASPLNRNGVAKSTNMALLSQGGARTRPPLKYLATLAYSPTLLVPFVFSKTQVYVIALSNTRADIYNTSGTVLASLTSAPWTTAMMTDGELTWTQFGDTLILCHPDMAMQKITRTGASSFTRAAVTFETASGGYPIYQPYYKFAAQSMTLTPGATSGTGVSLTHSSPGAWVAVHVGAMIRYKGKTVEITGYTSATVATGTVRETLADTTGSTDWDEQVFSAARGYARSAVFFLNRLVFGGSDSRPTGLWFSKIGSYYNFDLGTAADNEAIWEAITGPRVAEIRHLVGSRNLLVFTDRSMFYVPIRTDAPLTPDNIEVREQVPYGISACPPQVFDGAVLFAQDTGSVVREAEYDDVNQAYNGNAVSLAAAHLVSSPTQSAVLYGTDTWPEQYALFLNDDGTLAVYHGVRSQEIRGWSPWSSGGGTGVIKSICAVDTDVLVAVQRTLNSSTVWTLEIFDDTAAPLDCSKRATSGSPTRSFTGFTHLAGETVYAYSQGHDLGTVTVSGAGAVTLPDLAPLVEELEVGFEIDQMVRPMPAAFDLPEGTSTGNVLGVVKTVVEVDTAGPLYIGGNSYLPAFSGDSYDEEAETTTGKVEVWHLGYDKNGQKDIEFRGATRGTVLGITREIEIGG